MGVVLYKGCVMRKITNYLSRRQELKKKKSVSKITLEFLIP